MYEIIILLLLNIKECRVMSYNPIYSFLKTQYIVKCYTERESTNTQKSGRIKIIKPERENDYEVQ